MNQRFTRLNILDEKFGFLLDINGLLYCHVANLKEHWTTFINSYGHIVDNEGLFNDNMDCRMLLKKREKIETPYQLLEFIVSYGDESVFPNLRISIQILLTIAVSKASCERSFSKLKLILTYVFKSHYDSKTFE